MKDINEILDRMYAAKTSKPELEELTTDSKVSVWGNLFWVIAYVIDLLRMMFDTHKTEVNEAIRLQKSHTAINIRERLLQFMYGYTLNEEFQKVYLIPGTDEFDTKGMTAEQLEQAKIIKYAAVTESDDEKRVICKIATENSGELAPVSPDQFEAVAEYISQIKAAGVPYTVINFLPDMLRLEIRIFRDPMVLNATGVHKVTGLKPVEAALQEYMKELPFNGELILQEMANKIEKADGVRIVHIQSALTKWIDADVGDYPEEWEQINIRKIPVSGYFKIEDFNGINYEI